MSGSLEGSYIKFQNEEQKDKFRKWADDHFYGCIVNCGAGADNYAKINKTPDDVEKLGDGIRLFGGKIE